MTGCGCLVLVAALLVLLYVFVFGSNDPGEPIAEAAALLVAAQAAARLGRRASHPLTRS
ncbi:MAG: hypothetical protein KGJ98_00985 [Chloroflexota bacterium]|nr:hypothetical protein [Chloroflexota bacterium]MDE3100788.1 hypothetical protein [Chloroflexota bacterium]